MNVPRATRHSSRWTSAATSASVANCQRRRDLVEDRVEARELVVDRDPQVGLAIDELAGDAVLLGVGEVDAVQLEVEERCASPSPRAMRARTHVGATSSVVPIAGTRVHGVDRDRQLDERRLAAPPRRVIDGRYGSAGATSARGFVSTAPLGRPSAASAVITAAFAA